PYGGRGGDRASVPRLLHRFRRARVRLSGVAAGASRLPGGRLGGPSGRWPSCWRRRQHCPSWAFQIPAIQLVAVALLLSRPEPHLLLGVRAQAAPATMGLPKHSQRIVFSEEFSSATGQPPAPFGRLRSRILGWNDDANGSALLRLQLS